MESTVVKTEDQVNGSARPYLQHRLLFNDEIPDWYSQTHIYHGYRPIKNSIGFCLRSLTYLHNETVNIYSHLLPAILVIVLSALVAIYFESMYPRASRSDRLIFYVYLATSAICFSISSFYHTLLCHSKHYSEIWVRLDYIAILFQILGSFVSGIYVGFYCEANLRTIYWSMVRVLGRKYLCPRLLLTEGLR
jgi:adiponectin receptor